MEKRNIIQVFILLAAVLSMTACKDTKTGRDTVDLSCYKWKLWLDQNATWQDDSLYLPPVDLAILPVNEPGCGWDKLGKTGKSITLPATVEEYYWGSNGDEFGVNGDYTGVSWFSTNVDIPDSYRGKRIFLDFESVRFRAEVYVNKKLAGYDLVQGTPFRVDITPFVNYRENNRIDVRITDPNGNFTWTDFFVYDWGKTALPPSHGFGGITGKVTMMAVDSVYIQDIFIKNKPRATSVDVVISMANSGRGTDKGRVKWTLCEVKNPKHPVMTGEWDIEAGPGNSESIHTIDFPGAKFWSPGSPDLYRLTLSWNDDAGHSDKTFRHFGFRWFEIRDVDGDRQFFLNGKRIVLRTSISWGFWPVNGIYPTPHLAEKQIRTAKELGLNMLNFHRAMGQPIILDEADKLGLLYYEEPGGYAVGNTDFIRKWQRIRLERMVRRDRNHPALIIYNMRNEPGRDPDSVVLADLADMHNIDETRYKTWASNYFPSNFYGGSAPVDSAPGKLFVEPYNHDFLYQGWWDEHHAGGPGSYRDDYYNAPGDYYRFTNHKNEIIFYGEEGAIGTPPRLEKIAREIQASGQKGWDGDDYLQLYDAYNRFLDDYNFRGAFPTVDNLTLSMGNVAFYYQGRIIENIRLNNVTDGYAVNGWEENKIENHSGIVDAYRNPKGDVSLIANYNKPLYLAVKARKKVLVQGGKTILDVYIVNEEDIKGTFNLKILARNNGDTCFTAQYPVKVSGGNTYGELLKPAISLPLPHEGFTIVDASLATSADSVVTTGKEEIFTVNPCPLPVNRNVSYYDSTGFVKSYLEGCGIGHLQQYSGAGIPRGNTLVVANDAPVEEYGVRQQLLDWVTRGNTLVVVGNAPVWMDYLARKEVAEYKGARDLGILWYGGNHFVREHPLFSGLPVNTAFNWEYQCFAVYDRHRLGLRVKNGDIIVGAVSDHQKEVYSALGIIPHGKGKIIYSSLDFEGALKGGGDASVVAKRLFYNMVTY